MKNEEKNFYYKKFNYVHPDIVCSLRVIKNYKMWHQHKEATSNKKT